ncbi:MAG: pleC [Rickettsiaceae bacterium]|jgi:two-component system cell cycle sensor histidine kinase PleC|nr:pleC [Rickettsiaceae bacterium]
MLQNKNIIRFSFIALFITVLMSIIYYRYFMIERILLGSITESNTKLASVYKDIIWDRNHDIVKTVSTKKYEDLISTPEFVNFAKVSIDFFDSLDFIKVNFYDENGNVFLSTNSLKLNETSEGVYGSLYKSLSISLDHVFLNNHLDGTKALENAYFGQPTNQILPKAQVEKVGNSIGSLIVKSYIPLIDNDGTKKNVKGIIEIVTDTSKAMENITFLERRVFIIFLTVFVVFFAVVVYNTHNAQNIIDRQHEMNRMLEEAKIKAENESSEKTEFLANISHELRTPLNAIIGFSEIIQSEAYGAIPIPQYKDYINDINNSGKHLLSVINDILDFSKASADKLKVEHIDVDLTKIALASMRFVKPRADSNQVKLIEQVPEEHVIIKADPKRLKQALLNLLSNAVKFTPENGSVTLVIDKDEFNEFVYVKVIDTGIGIAEKDIPKALSSFGQVDNKLSRKYEGTGLGLPLTKKLIELMLGEFDIKSTQGKGTTVTLKFKLDTEYKEPESFVTE